MSNLIIPEEYKDRTLRPLQYPFRADGDCILDGEGVEVACVADAIAIKESLQLAKLFAAAPSMFETLGAAYIALSLISKNSGGDHGKEDEQDKESCLLCTMESILESVK